MDDALPFSANLLFANVAGLLGLALVILYTQPVIAIAFLPLALVYRRALRPGAQCSYTAAFHYCQPSH